MKRHPRHPLSHSNSESAHRLSTTTPSASNSTALSPWTSNIGVRTKAERAYNARKRKATAGKPTTSRFKGVYWDEPRAKWVARIGFEGKGRHLGRFRDELAAAEAYDEAARELFGAHARLNFPDGVDAFLAAEAAKVPEASAPGEQPSRAAA